MLVNYEWLHVNSERKYLTKNDLAGIPEGHKRLTLNMVTRLRTPVRERPQTKFSSSLQKSPASVLNLQRGKKLCLVLARQALDKKYSGHNVKPASRAQRLGENYSVPPGERFIEEKRHATEEKLAEVAEKRKVLEDCYQRIKEAAVIAITKIIPFAVVR